LLWTVEEFKVLLWAAPPVDCVAGAECRRVRGRSWRHEVWWLYWSPWSTSSGSCERHWMEGCVSVEVPEWKALWIAVVQEGLVTWKLIGMW